MTRLATGSPLTLTTLMLRNLPKKVAEWDVVAELCEAVPGVPFDLVYVPQGVDGATRAGYAFVNFSDTAAARAAHARLDGHLWSRASGVWRPLSVKIAHVQGLAQNLSHLRRGEMHKPGFQPPLVFVGGNLVPFDFALEVFSPETVVGRPRTHSGAHLVEPARSPPPGFVADAAGSAKDLTDAALVDACSEASTASSDRNTPVIIMRFSL
eukprot:CAMPEP_0170245128 /NCGR_PEP_ID=MMETSP0116_2-20130129/22347_1 /TAXON_ID=400756 /ORGANISM="Durinskia baltica, Strain CSIRO CS-38" /LENGTH=209 /DNA_ID=CAMNT_0010495997 /DNA_START=35 /DNA_END=664 /DNA_ORIENTATION=-